jgi:uncharacterized protein (TIGR03790 family)
VKKTKTKIKQKYMDEVHQHLTKKSSWYASWHTEDGIHRFHWFALSAIVILVGVVVVNAINPFIDLHGLSSRAAASDPSRVLIVYNSGFTGDEDRDGTQDSLQVANYYMQKRGVPSTNLVGINPMTVEWDGNYSNSSAFTSEIITPIKNKLSALGVTNIDVILFSYQTPWKINGRSIDTTVMAINSWSGNIFTTSNPYYEPNPTFSSDKGRFDHTYKAGNNNMYLVSRIDGPGGVYNMLRMIDNAIYAERYLSTQPGYLNGNVYIDSRGDKGIDHYTDAILSTDPDVQSGNFGGYAGTDVNIAYGEHYVRNSGLGLKWEKGGNLIGDPGTTFEDGSSATTAPSALFYGGWYSYGRYNDVYQWLPGAVGMDFDSINFAYHIRSGSVPAWGNQAMLHGLTAAVGVVGEPFTSGHPRPNVLIYYLLNGYTFAEASSLSIPSLGWMSISIGDPMYAPFKAKAAVIDNQAPQFAAGFPKMSQSTAGGNMVEVTAADSPEPEVVKVKVDYGTTSAYGQSYITPYYQRQHRIAIPELGNGGTFHYRVTMTDPAGNSTGSGDMVFSAPAQAPHGTAAWTIPGTIEIENFDDGGEGVAYHDQEPANYNATYQYRNDTGVEIISDQGVTWVWYAYPKEYLEYTVNVTQAGSYNITERVNPYNAGAGGKYHIEVDGINRTGTIAFPSGTAWTDVTQTGISMTAGQHTIRIYMEAGSPSQGLEYGIVGDFDKITFSLGSGGTPDTTPPTVSMSAPSNGATVSGTVSPQASASDNVSVAGVQFKLDGANFGAEDTNAPYSVSWDTTTVSNGSHTWAAVARDVAGNQTTASSISVNVNNIAPVGHITLNPGALSFAAAQGGATPTAQAITVANSGAGSTSWSASSNQSWCHISPASGSLSSGASTGPAVSVDSPSNAGTFNCTISFTGSNIDNSPQTLSVVYNVSPPPTNPSHLNLSVSSMFFSATSGDVAPAAKGLTLSNSGTGSSSWSASTNQNWCHVSPGLGTLASGGQANLSVAVDDPSNVGTFTCNVSISDPNADNSPQNIVVTYTVVAAPSPATTPVITSYQVTNKTVSTAAITWVTSQPTTGVIKYGTSKTNLDLQTVDSSSTTTHSITLTGLSKKTTYYYQITATNANGAATSTVAQFRTSPK